MDWLLRGQDCFVTTGHYRMKLFHDKKRMTKNDNWPHDCYNGPQLEHLRQQRKRRPLPWQLETTWPCSFFNLLQEKNMRSDEWYMVGLHLFQLFASFFLTRLVEKKNLRFLKSIPNFRPKLHIHTLPRWGSPLGTHAQFTACHRGS